MTYSKDLTRASEGRIEISGYPSLKFSKLEVADENFAVGDPVYNPSTEKKERLPGEPEFGTITLSTPESPFMRWEMEKLINDCKANPRKILTVAHAKGNQTRIYQGRLSGNRADTGTDKDASVTTISQMTLTIELSDRAKLV
jgi:hypothetical protein